MTPITKANIDELLDAHQICAAMKNGAWWRLRRNGATKRWKRDTNRIYVPVKAGLKSYYAITESDFALRANDYGATCECLDISNFCTVADLDAKGINHT